MKSLKKGTPKSQFKKPTVVEETASTKQSSKSRIETLANALHQQHMHENDEEDMGEIINAISDDEDEEDDKIENNSTNSADEDELEEEWKNSNRMEEEEEQEANEYIQNLLSRFSDQNAGAEDEDDEDDEMQEDADGFGTENSLSEEEKQRILREQMFTPAEREEIARQESAAAASQKHFTAQEIRSYKETEQLYSSSIFRLAFDEILNQIAIDWEKNKSIEVALHHLKQTLENLPSETCTIQSLFKNYLPFDPKFEQLRSISKRLSLDSFKIQFSKIEKVALIGSFLLRATMKRFENVDMAIHMPQSLFSKKETFESFAVKRAALLCFVAKHLSSIPMFSKIEWICFKQFDTLKPLLQITPQKDTQFEKFKSTKFSIKLFPAFLLHSAPFSLSSLPFSLQQATILQQQSLLEEGLFLEHLQVLHQEMKTCPAMIETILLFKIWSKQRHLLLQGDSLNGFLFSMILVYLLREGQLSRHMSPFQMLKQVFHFLIHAGLVHTNKMIILKNNNHSNTTTAEHTFSTLQSEFSLVFVEEASGYNLFSRMSKQSWQELIHEARLSMEYFLMDDKWNAMESLFLTPHHMYHKYDGYIKLSQINLCASVTKQGWSQILQLRNLLPFTLEQAWQDRVKFIRVIDLPNVNQQDLIIGFVLKKNWSVLFTKGPQVELEMTEERRKFEEFWGKEKTEVKMIASTNQSHVMIQWKTSSNETHQHRIWILETIAQHVLGKHCQLPSKNIYLIAKDVYSLIHLPESLRKELYQQLLQAVRSLEELLREKINVKLSLERLQCVDPLLRHTAVYPICQSTTPFAFLKDDLSQNYYAKPIPVILEYTDRNHLWPDSIEAICKLKQMMYISMAKQFSLAIANPTDYWCDVFFEGYYFRLVIRLEKELQILKSNGYALQKEMINMERELFLLPLHHQFISAFAIKYHLFEESCRIIKRWFHAHWLSDYFSEELIELLVSYLFIHPQPYELPNSTFTALARFLEFVSTFPWHQQCLYVSLQINADEKEDQKMQQQVMMDYELLPEKPVMYVVSSYASVMKDVWSKPVTSKMIVKRMASLAQQTIQVLQQGFTEQQSKTIHSRELLFTTDENCYDWILYLHSRLTHSSHAMNPIKEKPNQPNINMLVNPTNKTQKQFQQIKLQLIGFDPVGELIQELRDRFGKWGYFFRDALVNDRIGVVWNPSWKQQVQKLNLKDVNEMMPVQVESSETQQKKKKPVKEEEDDIHFSDEEEDKPSKSNKKSSKQIKEYGLKPNMKEILQTIREMGENIIVDIKMNQNLE